MRWPTSSLLQERRRTLHARIVEAIERLYPDRLAEHLERLAHHALRGEVWEKAVTYCRQAGAKALARVGQSGGGGVLRAGADRPARISPRPRDTREQAIDLRFDLPTRSCPSGEFRRILAYLREAEALAKALGDQRRLGTVLALNVQTIAVAMGDI